MYCTKCGKLLNDDAFFCSGCGTKVHIKTKENIKESINQDIPKQQEPVVNNLNNKENITQQETTQQYVENKFTANNGYQQSIKVIEETQPTKKKKSKVAKILIIVGSVFVAQVILSIILLCVLFNNYSNKLNASPTKSYTVSDEQDVTEEVTEEVSEQFTEEITEEPTTKENYIGETKVVGEDKYGYVTVPKNWFNFLDVDGASAIQFSYGNLYIVSLDYIEDLDRTAKDVASTFMYEKQNSNEVTGVTGAMVNIGKNNEYTAYQVYMYYPSENTYLITYWFEAEDGNIHYIALEGPGEVEDIALDDFLFIPQSFSLEK